ncbi:hypothetical protein JXB37_04210 [candidate division WOR-3 bacterium]|nr:hypothetical protein [candidate division WOR-3 bacterium]
MTIFAVGANINQLSEFIDVFKMRYVGLIDPTSSLYGSWRVPQPEAPYPQDYVIDQQGVVRYWSDQFDPQAVMATIDRLLATGVREEGPPTANSQRPTAGIVRGVLRAGHDLFRPDETGSCPKPVLLDACGRGVMDLEPGSNDVSHLSPGVYFVTVPGGAPARVVVLR